MARPARVIGLRLAGTGASGVGTGLAPSAMSRRQPAQTGTGRTTGAGNTPTTAAAGPPYCRCSVRKTVSDLFCISCGHQRAPVIGAPMRDIARRFPAVVPLSAHTPERERGFRRAGTVAPRAFAARVRRAALAAARPAAPRSGGRAAAPGRPCVVRRLHPLHRCRIDLGFGDPRQRFVGLLLLPQGRDREVC